LPRGIYWDRRWGGAWYVFDKDPSGKSSRKNVATAKALLSELHAIAEKRRGVNSQSLAWLLDQFHHSHVFADLADSTQRKYDHLRFVCKELKTKAGPLGEIDAQKLRPHNMQAFVDRIAEEGHPTKANHVLRYLRRVFAWGVRRGHCAENPCKGVAQAKERKLRRVPSIELMERVIAHARVSGSLQAHTEGSCPPYLWVVAELAYLMRLRGIEVLDLSDASELREGVRIVRRKGSRGNITRWTPRLRSAWNAAVEYRRKAIPEAMPVPIDPARRYLFVAQDGQRLSKSGLDSAWQRFMLSLVKSEVLTTEQRFGLHALKHRGITDTEGTRAEKQEASGHKSAAMMDVYDHSVPVVNPASSD